jgi:hypothetical protein
MGVLDAEASTNVERIAVPSKATPISDELSSLTAMLRDICPPDAAIAFIFQGKLQLQIDLRRFEDVTKLELTLPAMCGGIFRDVRRGQVGRHSFLHRLSALVER